jgi:hypothetical protein
MCRLTFIAGPAKTFANICQIALIDEARVISIEQLEYFLVYLVIVVGSDVLIVKIKHLHVVLALKITLLNHIRSQQFVIVVGERPLL